MKPVVCQHITKKYTRQKKKVTALDEVTFEVDEATLFGLIGPDGAGKTSLFRILTTLLLPTSGNAYVNGLNTHGDYKKIRRMIGYMPGRFSLYQDLSVRENLQFFASLFHTNIEDNYEQIRDIYDQLKPFEKRRAGNLSGGMKQKLALCCALVHRPTVLFLDEPTTGVDPVSRKEFWQMLKNLKSDGITIVVSTPYMDEAAMCDRMALIQDGRILKIATPDQVSDEYGRHLYAGMSADVYRLMTELRSLPGIRHCFSFGDKVHFSLVHETGDIRESLPAQLAARGITDFSMEEIRPGIEDIFMDLLESETV